MYTASSARCSTLPHHFGDTAALNNTRFTLSLIHISEPTRPY